MLKSASELFKFYHMILILSVVLKWYATLCRSVLIKRKCGKLDFGHLKVPIPTKFLPFLEKHTHELV